MNFDTTPALPRSLDREDELASFRDRFHLPKARHPGSGRRQAIYLCGNSLGLQPKAVAGLVAEELTDWAELAVRGHQEARRPWISYHEQLTQETARIVGARPLEVVNMNSLTVNLNLLMVSFYRPTQDRHAIVIERGAFPSDRQAAVSQLYCHGFSLDALIELDPRAGEDCLRHEDIESLLEREGRKIALVLLPGVQYRTGQAFDIERITAAAHKQGCLVGFDLAHAAGNLELALHDAGPDFAAWCSYKYLNSGPGAIAGVFVHERHAHAAELPRFAGWWGHDKARRFLMEPNSKFIPGAEGWQISNPPILSMAPLIASFALFREAGMRRLREKSQRLTGCLEFLLREKLAHAIDIVTPADPAERGCQLSLRVRGGATQGKAIFDSLDGQDVIADWREPDIIRVAPVPLYNSFEEVRTFTEALSEAFCLSR